MNCVVAMILKNDVAIVVLFASSAGTARRRNDSR